MKKSKKNKKIDLNFASLLFRFEAKRKILREKKQKNAKKVRKKAKIAQVKRSEKFEAKRSEKREVKFYSEIVKHNKQ